MIRRPPRSTQSRSSAASDVYKRQIEALNDVVNLTSKLTNSQKILPDKLPNNPLELSFWIGAHLGGPVSDEQQRLLEERDTYIRLQREYEMLDHTRKQLAARTALKESFPDVKEN